MSNSTLQITPEIVRYLDACGYREHEVLAELREDMRTHPKVNMQIAPEQGAFMQLLVKLAGVQCGIEIGTFTGYSALATALALPENGKLYCCDTSEEWTNIAKQYWLKAAVDQKIELRIAPALETLYQLQEQGIQLDWAFIDADKENYQAYYEHCVSLMRSGGLILIDNALWSGDVVSPKDEETAAIDHCNRFVFEDERVDMCLLPIADGLMLARKK